MLIGGFQSTGIILVKRKIPRNTEAKFRDKGMIVRLSLQWLTGSEPGYNDILAFVVTPENNRIALDPHKVPLRISRSYFGTSSGGSKTITRH